MRSSNPTDITYQPTDSAELGVLTGGFKFFKQLGMTGPIGFNQIQAKAGEWFNAKKATLSTLDMSFFALMIDYCVEKLNEQGGTFMCVKDDARTPEMNRTVMAWNVASALLMVLHIMPFYLGFLNNPTVDKPSDEDMEKMAYIRKRFLKTLPMYCGDLKGAAESNKFELAYAVANTLRKRTQNYPDGYEEKNILVQFINDLDVMVAEQHTAPTPGKP